MDRNPLPPPFPKGSTLRYVGTRQTWAKDGNGSNVPVQVPGLVVTVRETRAGRRGTLAPLPGEWEDDDPPLDTTSDGYSVYDVDVPGCKPFGRIIWPEDAGEWEQFCGSCGAVLVNGKGHDLSCDVPPVRSGVGLNHGR